MAAQTAQPQSPAPSQNPARKAAFLENVTPGFGGAGVYEETQQPQTTAQPQTMSLSQRMSTVSIKPALTQVPVYRGAVVDSVLDRVEKKALPVLDPKPKPAPSFSSSSGGSFFNKVAQTMEGGAPASSNIGMEAVLQPAQPAGDNPLIEEARRIRELTLAVAKGIYPGIYQDEPEDDVHARNPLEWFPEIPWESRFTDVWRDCMVVVPLSEIQKEEPLVRLEALQRVFTALNALLNTVSLDRARLYPVPSQSDEALDMKPDVKALLQGFTPDAFSSVLFPETQDTAQLVLQQGLRRNMAEILYSHANKLLAERSGDAIVTVAYIQLAPNSPAERDDIWPMLVTMAKPANQELLNEHLKTCLWKFAYLAAETLLNENPNSRVYYTQNIARTQDTLQTMMPGEPVVIDELTQKATATVEDAVLPYRPPVKEAAEFAGVVLTVIESQVQGIKLSEKIVAVVRSVMKLIPAFVVYSYGDMTSTARGYKPQPAAQSQSIFTSIQPGPAPQPPAEQEELPPEKVAENAREEEAFSPVYDVLNAWNEAYADAEAAGEVAEGDAKYTALTEGIAPAMMPGEGAVSGELKPLWPRGLYLCVMRKHGGILTTPGREDLGYLSGHPEYPDTERFYKETLDAPKGIHGFAHLAALITARLVAHKADPAQAAGKVVFLGRVAVGLFFDENISIEVALDDGDTRIYKGADALRFELGLDTTIDLDKAKGILSQTAAWIDPDEHDPENEYSGWGEAHTKNQLEADLETDLLTSVGVGLLPSYLREGASLGFLAEFVSEYLFQGLARIARIGEVLPADPTDIPSEEQPRDPLFSNPLLNTRIFGGVELLWFLQSTDKDTFLRDLTEPDLVPATALLRAPAHTVALASLFKELHDAYGIDPGDADMTLIRAALEGAATAPGTVLLAEKLHVFLVSQRNSYRARGIGLYNPMSVLSVLERRVHPRYGDIARLSFADAFLAFKMSGVEVDGIEWFKADAAVNRILVRFASEFTPHTASPALWPLRTYRLPSILGYRPGESEEEVEEKVSWGEEEDEETPRANSFWLW